MVESLVFVNLFSAAISGLEEKENQLQGRLLQLLYLITYHILNLFFISMNYFRQWLRQSPMIPYPWLELLLEQCR